MKTKIVSFEAACKITGRDPKAVPIVTHLSKKDQEYHIANHKLLVIADGLKVEYSKKNKLKETWKPNYNDTNQSKYETYFWVNASDDKPSGFGFSGAHCVNWYTLTHVGSRFAFPTSEMAIYFGEKFADLHIKTKLE